MADRPTTVRDDELHSFLDASRLVISAATGSPRNGTSEQAALSDSVDSRLEIRAIAAAVIALAELRDYEAARGFASFLLTAQSPSGAWARSCDREGRSASLEFDEDVTALAIWALMHYVRASGAESFAEQAREQVEEAARFTRARTLNSYLYLVETTSSIHGPGVSAGYELWNNCAHAAAFALCHRVYGGEPYRRLALLIRRAIGLLMTADGRFLRRLDPSGYPDPRPDVCLIAPYYFGLWGPSERTVMNSAEQIERTLWNVEIGGYIRYLPYSAAERDRLFGPAPLFGAWMAQYHFELGNKDRAEAILRWLFDNLCEWRLAEVLVSSGSVRRFLPEQRRSLGDRLDPRHRAQQGDERLLADLEAVEEAAGQRDIVPIGVPSAWAHVEVLRALRRGGYLNRWDLKEASARLADEEPVT